MREKALDLLSRRRLSRGELRDKLLYRKYDQAEIEALLDHYQELGYLNDESLAVDYAQQRLELKPMGHRLLRMELLKRRLPEDMVEEAVDKAFEQASEEAVAERAISTLLRRTRLKTRLWNRLARLGFPYDVIDRVIANHYDEIEEESS